MTRKLIIDGNAVYELDETYMLQEDMEIKMQKELVKTEGTGANNQSYKYKKQK